jgi:thiol:disulfide interchange protein DsbD
MFGAFDIQLPTSLQNRLNTVGGAGPVGAFLMGLVSGFVSAPCTGPVLLSLLMYIAQASAAGGSVLYGGSLLFVYALGMGTLFFAVALGAGLLRPGVWMEHVKSVFGIALLVMAIWFLRPLSADLRGFVVDPEWGIGAGLGMIAVGLGLGAVHLSFHGDTVARLRKAFGVGLSTVGAVVVLNGILYVPPMAWHEVRSIDDFERAVAQAEADNEPVLVDFSATWCTPCLEMEVQTFHDERVEPLLATRFTLVKIDVTDPTDDQSRIQDATRSGTLPAVLVYGADAGLSRHIAGLRAGEALPPAAVRFDTFVEADVFLEKIEAFR